MLQKNLSILGLLSLTLVGVSIFAMDSEKTNTHKIKTITAKELLKKHKNDGATSVAISPDGKKYALGIKSHESYYVELWNIKTGKKIISLMSWNIHNTPINSLVFRSEKTLTSTSDDVTIEWNFKTSELKNMWTCSLYNHTIV